MPGSSKQMGQLPEMKHTHNYTIPVESTVSYLYKKRGHSEPLVYKVIQSTTVLRCKCGEEITR